jgi:hypothetical protein
MPGQRPPTTNILSIISLVLSALGLPLFCCCNVCASPLPIAGIVCGAIALSQINKDPQTHKGKELAFAGIGVGALGLLLGLGLLIYAIATGGSVAPDPSQFQNF